MPTISGITRNSVGAIASKFVRVYRRDSGALVAETYSDPTTGAYSVSTADTSEHCIIMHDSSGDPHWGETILACHFNGSNGSTTFTDEKGHTLTAVGNAQLTTTSPKFGSACATFDGTGDYVTVSDTADLELGSSDLTIEFWIKTTQTLGYACPLGRDNGTFPAGAWSILLNGNGSGSIQLWCSNYSSGSVFLQSAAISLNDGNWHHIAITRSGSAWSIWKDGVSVASNTWAGSIADAALDLNIGRDPGYSRDFNGQLDDLRITKTARYTANFVPPAIPFADGALGGTENALIFDRVIPV